MSERFFVDRLVDTQRVELGDTEAHHLIHVLRGKVGDQVKLFDGSGFEFTAHIREMSRKSVSLQIDTRILANKELPGQLIVATCLPKGDRQKFLVEKLVELGVTSFIPIISERSNIKTHDRGIDRLKRVVIEASKQCTRNRLMQIQPIQSLSQVLASYSEEQKLIAHPFGAKLNSIQTKYPTIVLVGPEGGFSDTEIELATKSGWQVVAMGNRILRIETAAVALASWISLSDSPV